jgi:hypothetical protein
VLLNELAQWAALLLLGFFVLGLTRQLGNVLVSPRERVEQNRGPRLGRRLPAAILGQDDRERLLALMQERSSNWAALLVVGEDCPRCGLLIERLMETGMPDGAPVAVLSDRSGPDHRTLLDRAADLVIVDSERLAAADLNVKPFVLILDDSLRVRHKQVAWDLSDAVSTWRGDEGRRSEQGAVTSLVGQPNDGPTTVQVGGGRGEAP